MYCLLYSSNAKSNIDTDALQKILHQSIRFNGENEITGLLLFRNRRFMQLLEGEETTVKALYRKICTDKRHKNCQILLTDHIEKRNLAQWNMGFLCIEHQLLRHYYVNFIIELANKKFLGNSKIFHDYLLDFARSEEHVKKNILKSV